MRARKLFLPLVVLCVAGIALPQSTTTPSVASNVSPADVIVPWRHFGPAPAPSAVVNDPPAPQVVSSESSDPPLDAPADPPPSAQQTADTQSPPPAGQKVQLYEADISKKHPHPPEPVKLPAATQVAPPLTNVKPGVFRMTWRNQAPGGKNSQPETKGQSAAASSTPPTTPESHILALTASYRQRAANRAAELQQLKATTATDSSAQLQAQIQETQLLYEGEQDHMQSAQRLSEAYASLAAELDDRAVKVRGLAESRQQGMETAEADLNHMKGIMPTVGLALHNFAMLPAGEGNNQMIGALEAELAQDENTRKLNEERSVQAQNEMKALQADVQRLEQATAMARQKSASYAEELQEAQAKESLLSDKLEYLIARQSAADLLASASKVLESPAEGGVQPAVVSSTMPFAPSGGQDVDGSPARLPLPKIVNVRANGTKRGP